MDNTNNTLHFQTKKSHLAFTHYIMDTHSEDFADSAPCDNTFLSAPSCSLFDMQDYDSDQMDEELYEAFAATFDLT